MNLANAAQPIFRKSLALMVALISMLIAAVSASAQSLNIVQLHSGNGTVGGPDAAIHCLVNPPDAPFTPAQFDAARAGATARIVGTLPNGLAALPADSSARWISDTGTTTASARVLYAIDFELAADPSLATLEFWFVVDDAIGSTATPGLYLNGQPIAGSNGGGWTVQNALSFGDVRSLLHAGTNTLYVYARNTGGPGALMFSAKVSTHTVGLAMADGCAGAIELPVLPVAVSARGTTIGATTDNVPVCPGGVHQAPGVWYRFRGAGFPVTLTTCNYADFDTILEVYCGSCAAPFCAAANDDDCFGGGSRITFCAENGRDYYVLVSGYGTATGTFDLTVSRATTACNDPPACAPPTITIPPGAIAEGEPPCSAQYDDHFNAGCLSNPPRFSPIAPGQVISGYAGTFVRAGQDYRDTDLYEFTLPAAAEVTVVAAGTFPVHLGLMDGRQGCRPSEVLDFGETRSVAGQEATIRRVLPAGRFVVFLAPSALSGIPCDSPYYLRLTSTPVGACQFGTSGAGGCVLLTAASCTAQGGAYSGDGTLCEDVNYAQSVLPAFAFDDIRTSGSLLPTTNNPLWDADDGGAELLMGFPFVFYDRVYTSVRVSTNGYITFGSEPVNAAFPRTPPDPRSPNALIAPRWSNLNLNTASDPAGGGDVRYQVLGAAPTRRLVVQWTNCRQFGFTTTNTFQALLSEADGAIEFRYLSVQPPAFDGQVRAGVENAEGTLGTNLPAGGVQSNTRIEFRRGNFRTPEARAGGPYTVSASNQGFSADATGSRDPDGQLPGFAAIRNVQWDLGADGTGDDVGRTNPTQPFTLAQALAKGLSLTQTVPLRLTVTDFDSLSANDQTAISYTNSPPTATAGGPYGPIPPGGTVTLAGTASDPDQAVSVGEQLSIEWATRRYVAANEFGGPYAFATGVTPTLTFAQLLALNNATGTTIWMNVKDASGSVAASQTVFSLLLPDLSAGSPVGTGSAAWGSTITVTATVTNTGGGATAGAWTDAAYLTAGTSLNSPILRVPLARPADLPGGGGQYTQSFQMQLPVRFDSGVFYVTVKADDLAQVAELNEGNNASAPMPISLTAAPAPDLAVSFVSGPVQGSFGSLLHARFTVTNIGNLPTTAAWNDAVILASSSTASSGLTLRQEPGQPLDPGASYTRELDIPTPVDPITTGTRYIVVRVDSGGTITEPDESNNSGSSGPIAMSPTNSANLVVASANAPSTGTAGRPIDITWTGSNTGTAAALGSWIDRVVLRDPATGQSVMLGEFQHDGPLVPTQTYTQAQIVRLPADIQGPRDLCIITDANNTVTEPTTGAESDNTRCVTPRMQVVLPAGPDLAPPTATVASANPVFGAAITVHYTVSNTGDSVATGSWSDRVFLSRDGTLSSDDVALTVVPIDGPVAANDQYSRDVGVTLPLSAAWDTGDYYLLVFADASQSLQEKLENNNVGASSAVHISRPPLPNLSVSDISTPSPATPGAPATVTWNTRNTGSVPITGRWTERVYAVPDGSTDGPLVASVLFDGTIGANGSAPPRSANFSVPNAGLSYRMRVCTDAAEQMLESVESDNCDVGGLAQINRPDIAVSSVTAPDIAVADSQMNIVYSLANVGAAPTPSNFLVSITLVRVSTGERILLATANELQQLQAGVQPVTRTQPVTIPTRLLGEFAVEVAADVTNTILESGPPENNTRTAANIITVVQPPRPNLVVSDIQRPGNGLIGTTLSVTYTVQNIGDAPVSQAWVDRVVAVRTDIPTLPETILGEVQQQPPLTNQGQGRTQSATFTYPSQPGTYRLRVITDRADTVYEGDGAEGDNIREAAETFLSETFLVTVVADTSSAPAGTPVHVIGQAVTTSGTPIAGIPIEVRVVAQRTSRELYRPDEPNQPSNRPLVTDALGNFTSIFSPLPTEGGRYGIFAGPRGNLPQTAAAEFSLYALNLGYSRVDQTLQSGVPATINVPVINPGDEPVTGVSAALVGDLTDLTATATVPAAIAVNSTSNAQVLVTALSNQALTRNLTLRVSSPSTGLRSIPVTLTVRPTLPSLSVTPRQLAANVVRGEQTLVTFDIENVGTVTAGEMAISLPNISWMHVVNPALPILSNGQHATVTLQLDPPTDQPLGTATGTIAVSNATGSYGVSMPFAFRITSNRATSLVVRVEDEATYYDTQGNYISSGGPIVDNATVQLRDPVTNQVLYQGITQRFDPNQPVQPVRFTDIPERQYLITVDAQNHGSYSQTTVIDSQFATRDAATGYPLLRAFVAYQAVRFNWIVQETTVTDVTVVTLQAVYQTNVPVPTVVVDPPLIDLARYPSGGQIDLRISNPGLIAVENVSIGFPSHPSWRLTPLVSNLGTLGPGGTRTVPVTIEKLESPGDPENGGPCYFSTCVQYELFCIVLNLYCSPITAINANSNCNATTAPSFPSASNGSSGGGPNGPSGPVWTFSPPPVNSSSSGICSCDPATFQQRCAQWNFEGDLGAVKDAVNAALEHMFGGLGGVEVNASVSTEGRICVCCLPDGHLGLSGEAEGEVEISGAVKLGGNLPVSLPAVPITIQGQQVLARVEGRLSAEINILEIQGALGLRTEGECGSWPRLCITGRVSALPLNGAELGVFGTVTVLTGPYAGYSYTGGLGAQLNVDAALDLVVNTCESPWLAACGRYSVRIDVFGGGINLRDPNFFGNTVVGSGNWGKQLLGPSCSYIGHDCCPESPGGGSPGVAFPPAPPEPRHPHVLGFSSVIEDAPAEGPGTCARVRLQLDQNIAVTRTAISGTLEIDNSASSAPVENLRVALAVYDASGADLTDRFAISTTPTLTGVTAVDGTGRVAPNVRASANWIILPTRNAAPTNPVDYSFGGIVYYTQNGAARSFIFPPVQLTVRPDPLLNVKYFLQREVYADDPFTPGVTEPSEPFTLGLMMTNSGYGTARNVNVASSQPRILDNTRQLLIDFFIVGAQVGNQTVQPSLSLALGDIAPQTTKVGRYLLTTTLLGFFESFNASFRRRPDFGIDDARVALIDSVTTYDLVRTVRSFRPTASGTPADDLPDFLTDELHGLDDPNEDPTVPALAKLPDRIHLSDGTVSSVASIINPSFQNIPGTSQFRLRFTPVPGFVYADLPDPTGGQLRVLGVRRSDGRQLPTRPSIETTEVYNVWQSTRVFRDRQRPLFEPRIHLFDDGGTGDYVFSFDTQAQSVSVVGWRSLASHGSLGLAGIDSPVSAELVEGREGGPAAIEFISSERINPASFTPLTVAISGKDLLGTPLDLSALIVTTSVSTDGRTGRVTFGSRLPAKARFCIRVNGVTDVLGRFIRDGMALTLTTLPGDVNGDRTVSLRDQSLLRSLLTAGPVPAIDPANSAMVRGDVNRDGRLDDRDYQFIATREGLDARWIADPCWTGVPVSTVPGLPLPSLNYDEFEPNQSKPNATIVTFSALDHITGTSTGNATTGTGDNTADYYRVGAPTFPVGIYRHRLTLTTAGPAQHTTTIRGLAQQQGTIDRSSDIAVQSVAPPTRQPPFNQWYGFGSAEQVYYTVTGTSQTTSPYEVRIKSEPVTPVWLGEFAAGPLTITTRGQGHSSDTEIMLLDNHLVPIPEARNDDSAASGPGAAQSTFTFALSQGTYYLAISDRNTTDDQPSPPNDFSRSQPVLDRPGALVNSSTASQVDVSFAMSDAHGENRFPAFKEGPFDVWWGVMTVGTCLADVVGIGQVPAPDGLVTADDFVAFLNAFAAGDLLADVTGIGGPPAAPDGLLTGDDFVAFITSFADGCP